MHHFDTSNFHEAERHDRWREEVCRSLCRSDSVLRTPGPFSARLSSTSFGALLVSSVECQAASYERAVSDIRISPNDDFLVSLLLEGKGNIEQDGRQATQQPGDLVVYDTARPFLYQFPGYYRMALIKVPRRAMLSRVPKAESITSRVVPSDSATGRLAAGLIGGAMSLDLENPTAAMRIGTSLVEVLAAAIDVELVGQSRGPERHSRHLAKAKEYMLSHLDDIDLDLQGIAHAIHASPSTLSRVFAGDGTTVMRWLWGERLRESHRALSEGQARQVTEVALRYGFSSFSHFSRSFKTAYGATPQAVLRGATVR